MLDIFEIPGYPKMGASVDGRIWKHKNGGWCPVHGSLSAQGYIRVYVGRIARGKRPPQMMAHRLVAITFLGLDVGSELQVNHKNLNKQDNSVRNLELLSGRDNRAHYQRMAEAMNVATTPFELPTDRATLEAIAACKGFNGWHT